MASLMISIFSHNFEMSSCAKKQLFPPLSPHPRLRRAKGWRFGLATLFLATICRTESCCGQKEWDPYTYIQGPLSVTGTQFSSNLDSKETPFSHVEPGSGPCRVRGPSVPHSHSGTWAPLCCLGVFLSNHHHYLQQQQQHGNKCILKLSEMFAD